MVVVVCEQQRKTETDMDRSLTDNIVRETRQLTTTEDKRPEFFVFYIHKSETNRRTDIQTGEKYSLCPSCGVGRMVCTTILHTTVTGKKKKGQTHTTGSNGMIT